MVKNGGKYEKFYMGNSHWVQKVGPSFGIWAEKGQYLNSNVARIMKKDIHYQTLITLAKLRSWTLSGFRYSI